MKIYLGKTSLGERITREIKQLEGIFVVYCDNSQWENFLNQCHIDDEEQHVIRISSITRLEALKGNINFDTLPELWMYVKQFLGAKKMKHERGIVLIFDDVFQLNIFSNKKSAQLFLKLLITGPQIGLHCVLGTSTNFRGLIKELLLRSKLKESYLTFFSELVISDEHFYFFKEKGRINYERRF